MIIVYALATLMFCFPALAFFSGAEFIRDGRKYSDKGDIAWGIFLVIVGIIVTVIIFALAQCMIESVKGVLINETDHM